VLYVSDITLYFIRSGILSQCSVLRTGVMWWCRRSVFKYFSGAGEVFLYIYLSDTSPAPEKPVKYLKTPFRRRRSIYTHFSGTGEVFIYTCRAQEKPKKYLYTPFSAISISLSISF